MKTEENLTWYFELKTIYKNHNYKNLHIQLPLPTCFQYLKYISMTKPQEIDLQL